MFYTEYMGLLPTTRFSAASEPCGSACSDSGTAVTVSVTGPLDRVYHQALPLAVDSGCRPLFRDFTSCRALTRATTRDNYSHNRRLPPSSRFFYFAGLKVRDRVTKATSRVTNLVLLVLYVIV